MKKLIVLLVAFQIFSSNVFASWKLITQDRFFFESSAKADGFIESTLPMCQLPSAHSLISGKSKYGAIKWDFPEIDSNRPGTHYTGEVFLQKRDNLVVKAPVMILVPGIFSSAVERNSAAVAHWLHKAGYHVLLLPNPWHVDSIKVSKYAMGSIEKEASTILELSNIFVSELEVNNLVSDVHLLGISYGAFLSSLMAEMDSKASSPLFSKVMLISPPHDIRQSLNVVDEIMAETADYADKMGIVNQAKFFIYLCKRYDENEFDLSQQKDFLKFEKLKLNAVTAVSEVIFKKKLEKSLKLFEKTFDGEVYDLHQENSIDFKRYMALYQPDIWQRLAGKTKVTYWVDQSEERLPGRISILSAENDFINPEDAWSGEEDRENLLLLKRGGHGTLIHLPWIQEEVINVLRSNPPLW